MTDGPERMTTGRVRASDGESPRELGDVSPSMFATGDPADVADLVDTFLREAPALVAGLRTARQSGDAEEVRRAADTLNSNARTFGAAGLANLCQELENTAKRQVMSEAGGLVTNIEDEYARVASALATAREERRRA
jgi:HPt (histidine-containing phosphotransfer) domain-containing protein